ncbi:hypothetical protein FOA52_008751 [Chlamydomonas sp. UWO 241]|nr:hypothetical protein FOA52_008751 [Chlamydomonas sp. UWO 241]
MGARETQRRRGGGALSRSPSGRAENEDEADMGQARASDLPAPAGASDEALYTVVPKWLALVALWFTGTERWQARAYAAAVVSISLLNSMFLVRISYAQRNFSTAMSEKDVPGFYKSIGDFAVIICIAAPLFSLNSFLEDRLVLSWRAYLTRVLLEAYFSNRSYFHLKQQAMVGTTDAQQSTTTDDATLPAFGAAKTNGQSCSDGTSSSSGGVGSGSASSTVDNPDQRICDDVGAFCRSSSSLTLALIKKVFNCAAFAGVLWSVSPTLVYFLFGYAIFGTFTTTAVFGKVLTVLYFQLLASEGDMRFSLVRVREHAESIAFYAGGAQELRVVLGRLERVVSTTFTRIRWTALYDLWTSVYNYATILVPSLLTAPRYFRGEIEFGVISQTSFAFSSIEAALSVIINNLAQLSGLAAETNRLHALLAAMEANARRVSSLALCGISRSECATSVDVGAPHLRPHPRAPPCLAISSLCVHLPGSSIPVWRDLTLELSQGQSLLIVGPSGCGKSSLLRALCGLWSDGSGCVSMPPAERLFFLPQKPYMPLGTLRQQLTFPNRTDHHASSGSGGGGAGAEKDAGESSDEKGGRRGGRGGEGGRGGGRGGGVEAAPLLRGHSLLGDVESSEPVTKAQGSSNSYVGPSDAELAALLSEVCLPDLLASAGGLDETLDWAHVLSSGEQQRVAFLRLLHRAPMLAFLDEATSAVDAPTEALLYGLLRDRAPCYVSVGHRLQLARYHTHVLEHAGPDSSGGWELLTSFEYQARAKARGQM